MKKIKKFIVRIILLILISLAFPFPAKAQDIIETIPEQCGNSLNVVRAVTSIPEGSYDVFAKSNRVQDEAKATLLVQPILGSSCNELGSTLLNTNLWSRVGGYESKSTEPVSLNLSIEKVSDSFGGSDSPSVIFVPKLSACADINMCFVEYDGKQFELQPKKISFKIDLLKVGILYDIDEASLSSVIYSVDNKIVYTKDILESFNLNYVGDGRHTLQRNLLFSNGVVLRDETVVNRGFSTDGYYTLISIFFTQSKAIQLIASGIGIIGLILLVLFLSNLIESRRKWRKNHIANTNNTSHDTVVYKTYDQILLIYWLKKTIRIMLLIVLVGIVFLSIYSHVLGVFTVDGVSMEPTLKDRNKHILFKLPATLGAVSKNGYIPKLGQIVVVKEYNEDIFQEDASQEPRYVVKRVIGIPGDRVVVLDDEIKVFSRYRSQGFVPDDEYKWVNDRSAGTSLNIDITLKENEIFVVGDNRDESIDSRYYGAVKSDQIVGTVIFY